MTSVQPVTTALIWKAVVRLANSEPWTKGFPGRFIAQDVEKYLANEWVGWADTGDGVPAGYVVIRPQSRQAFTWLHWMGVAPEHRGKEIGRKLIRYAWFHNPHPELRLHVATENAAARALYEKTGFSEIGVRYTKRGDEELVLMAHRSYIQ